MLAGNVPAAEVFTAAGIKAGLINALASLKFRCAAVWGDTQRGTGGGPGAVQARFLAGGAVDLTPHVPGVVIIHLKKTTFLLYLEYPG